MGSTSRKVALHRLWTAVGSRSRDLLFKVRCASWVDRCRSTRRHANHILRHGRRAWRQLPDVGLNGSIRDLEFYLRRQTFYDINRQDRRGNTLLMQAARTNNAQLLVYLLGLRATDIGVKNEKGQTALIVALESRAIHCVELLAECGAVDDAERQGLCPLHHICSRRSFHIESLAILLRFGVDINAVQRGVGTPLRAAILARNKPLAYLLHALGAKLDPQQPSPDVEELFVDDRLEDISRHVKKASKVALVYLQCRALRTTRSPYLPLAIRNGKCSVKFLDQLIELGAVRVVHDHDVYSCRCSSFLTLADVSYWFPET